MCAGADEADDQVVGQGEDDLKCDFNSGISDSQTRAKSVCVCVCEGSGC